MKQGRKKTKYKRKIKEGKKKKTKKIKREANSRGRTNETSKKKCIYNDIVYNILKLAAIAKESRFILSHINR